MGLYIIAGALFINAVILFSIFTKKNGDCDEWVEAAAILIGIIIVGSILTLLAGIFNQAGNSRFIETYQKTSNYIENYNPENEIEQAAVLNKKIEINEKLFKLQYWAEKTPFFVMYADEIIELESIK